MAIATRIAVVGFTGKMGRLVTAHLLSRPNVQVHGLCRSPSKVPSTLSSHLDLKIFGADSGNLEALRKGLAGASACICCYMGSNDFMVSAQKILINACIAESVPRYIASDYCLDYRGIEYGTLPSKDPMIDIRAYIEEKEKETEGNFKGVHILNGALTEIVWSPLLGIVDTENDVIKYWGSGNEGFDQATYDDVAKYTTEVALDPKVHGFMNFMTDRLSPLQMSTMYSQTYNVTPKLERLGSLSDLHALILKTRSERPNDWHSWLGLMYYYHMTSGRVDLDQKKLDNARYPGVKTTGTRHWLEGLEKGTVSRAFMS